MTSEKAEVREFWNARSCGEVYAAGNTAEGFRAHADVRYRLEPCIRGFARFGEGSGRDILEIGVGMGADHVEWAKSGPRRLTGVDLTPRAVAWTAQRLATYGFPADVSEADAEQLPFLTAPSTSSIPGVSSITPRTPLVLSARPTVCSGRAERCVR
jgi:methyltransferase family protein